MSSILISTYQIIVTSMMVALFIMFWTTTHIDSRLISIENKISRIIVEHEMAMGLENRLHIPTKKEGTQSNEI